MDTYAKHTGNFTYFTDWSGFNIPGNIVCEYKDNHLASGVSYLNKERLLFASVSQYIQDYGEDFYLLAIYKETDIKHELAHACYYLYPEYRKGINKLINKRLKHFKDQKKKLLEMGYRPDMIDDEQQAYLLEAKLSCSVPLKIFEMQKKVKKLFARYTSGLK